MEQEQNQEQIAGEFPQKDLKTLVSLFNNLEDKRKTKDKARAVSAEALETEQRYWETIKKDKPVESFNVPQMKEQTFNHIKEHLTKNNLITLPHLMPSYLLFMGVQFYEPKFLEIANAFFKTRLDPKKGVLLIGIAGTGKTATMDHCRKICNHWGQYEKLLKMGRLDSCIHIAEDALRSKLESVDKFKKPLPAICLDDLGAERAVNSYGNSVESVAEVLTELHLHFCRSGMKTFATSNLSVSELANRYGSRVIDRMRQMFNIVAFPSHIKSLRG